jgi:hypothetical protein
LPKPIEPLSETRYRIQLNASVSLKEKLSRLRAIMSHSNPSGDIAVAIERALDIALEKLEGKRFAMTDRPRPSSRSPQAKPLRSRHTGIGNKLRKGNKLGKREHIPNAVLREIAARDQLRCTYRSADGRRCMARAFLQVHHETPWARGGHETLENLRLLCSAHNRLQAERDFGVEHVERRMQERLGGEPPTR